MATRHELGVRCWQQDTIFDIRFSRYRTRAESSPGPPRRYAWEAGEVCEYRVAGGEVERRTALLIHLQKRTMREPAADVLDADRYWIDANRFSPQQRVDAWTVRRALVPTGREIVPLYWRLMRRSLRCRAARRRRNALRLDEDLTGARSPVLSTAGRHVQ